LFPVYEIPAVKNRYSRKIYEGGSYQKVIFAIAADAGI
jgi:hypothetical protein